MPLHINETIWQRQNYKKIFICWMHMFLTNLRLHVWWIKLNIQSEKLNISTVKKNFCFGMFYCSFSKKTERWKIQEIKTKCTVAFSLQNISTQIRAMKNFIEILSKFSKIHKIFDIWRRWVCWMSSLRILRNKYWILPKNTIQNKLSFKR